MIRVLQANSGSVNYGGVSSFLMNVYRNIDRNSFQFDFLTMDKTTYSPVREEIEEMEGRVFELRSGEDLFRKVRYVRRLRKHLQENHYDIIHINSGSPGFQLLTSSVAKRCTDARIICHSHSTNPTRNPVKLLLFAFARIVIRRSADCCLACSDSAGKFMFGENQPFTVVNNGIDLHDFRFDAQAREEIREEQHIRRDEKVVGFIGRLEPVKNPLFAVEVFRRLQEMDPLSRLWVVGNGSLRAELEERIARYGLKEKAVLLGERTDVSKLIQAMDAVIMPSLYEGLGIVAVEAQAAKALTVVSDAIPSEAECSSYLQHASLSEKEDKWAEMIFEHVTTDPVEREKRENDLSRFDIRVVARQIEKIYEELCEK